MTKYIFGVDVGFSGAIAIISVIDGPLHVIDMPVIKSDRNELNTKEIKELFLTYPDAHVYIEKAQAMPKQGCVSMFRYGEGFGIIKGILAGLGIPYTLVTPQEWKKEMMSGMSKEKGASILRVNQLFPEIDIGNRKKDHGKADAILIAEYGRIKI